MKKILLILLLLITATHCFADGVVVAIDPTGKPGNEGTNTTGTVYATNNFTAAGNITASQFVGGATSLTSLNATQLTSGTVPVSRIPLATTSLVGGVSVDGTTVLINGSGQISATGTSDASTNGYTVIWTNLALNVVYTNTYGSPMLVNGLTPVFITAVVAGRCTMNISMTNSGVATNITPSQVTVGLLGSSAGNMTNSAMSFIITNGGTFCITDTSTGAGNSVVTAGNVSFAYVQQLAVANNFAGNGGGLTNIHANALQWTNQTASGSITNFIIDLSGAPNVVINLLADGCVTGLTNGPGSVSVTVNCGDGSPHNFLIPSAFHLLGNTNIISAIKGTNSLIVVTNTCELALVFKPIQVAISPNGTNSMAFMGESGN